MPQIKLDFLYMVQTWVLADRVIDSASATYIAWKALEVSAECLSRDRLDDQVDDFCVTLRRTLPSPAWVKWETK